MDKKTQSCKVSIAGSSYSIITSESSEHIAAAAELVDRSMQDIKQRAPSLDQTKVAVLAALRIASALLVKESEINAYTHEHESLIHLIDQNL